MKPIATVIREAMQSSIDRIAARGNVDELGAAVAISLACGDFETVNYIGNNYAHMFNDEQQRAFADIKALAAQHRDQKSAQTLHNVCTSAEMNAAVLDENPLSEHLANLNNGLQ